ncbi:MAG TPA: aspartyl protease family protein [Nannocystaceae bacterium]|nr:aspartyl protease family protein [Nannocystaceae bacterium]
MRLAVALLLCASGCMGARAAQRARAPADGFAFAVAYEDAAGLPIVDVAIDGIAERQRFVVDTGAGTTVISTRLDRALGRRRHGHIIVADATGRREQMAMARLAGLELGGVRFTDVGAAVLELTPVEQNLCTRIDGILGTNVFQHGVLELDYPAQEVRLASDAKRLPARDGGEPLALVAAWMPYLAIEREGDTVGALLLDTGSAGALSVPATLREPLGITEVASGQGLVGVGAHGPARGTKHAFAWPRATIGGHDFTGVDTIAHDTDTGTLGAKVLRAYVLRIDYRERTAMLWGSDDTLPRGASSFGFEWSAGAESRVEFVWEGSAAHRAGIAVGQPITAIDGRALASLDAQERCVLARDMSLPGAVDEHQFEIAGRTWLLRREPLVEKEPAGPEQAE